ncbi:MAG: sigma-54-dependent Fis family transcriptional regulator [Candidatus Eisenbacteria bacterium]|nr:sigma-54-dependent Fis family transcriptional regulator [Candidatus Eisenbacteria bacterium]
MLVRVLLAVPSREEQKRLAGLIQRQADVLLSGLEGGEVVWDRLAADPHDLVVIARSLLPEPVDESISAIRNLPDRPEVIVVGETGGAEEQARMLAAGGLAVLLPELPDNVLADELRALTERRREHALNRLDAERPRKSSRLSDFVTLSPAMLRLMAIARQVAGANTSLLLLGETGVGKEWLARAIHEEGNRAEGPFIAVNCGAIPETLIESELFGHEEGAFTDARKGRRGHFELAHRGTIFLDEIADLSTRVQVKLLRVLQERKIQRVGGEKEIEVDVRIMAATNRDLMEEVRAGRFRSDLYYRLGVVTLTVPPLRQRREDIPDLVRNYLGVYRNRLGRDLTGIRPEAMAALVRYDWPGNVRELINVIERTVLLCPLSEIRNEDLPEEITRGRREESPGDAAGGEEEGGAAGGVRTDRPLREARREAADAFERAYLDSLLHRTRGRIGETARLAGITPRALFDKMRRHGLRKEDYR